jgi:hypothetical protein
MPRNHSYTDREIEDVGKKSTHELEFLHDEAKALEDQARYHRQLYQWELSRRILGASRERAGEHTEGAVNGEV